MRHTNRLSTISHLFFIIVLAVATAAGQTPFVKFYPLGEASFVNDAIRLSPERLVLAGNEFSLATGFSGPRVLTLDADGEVVNNECLLVDFTESVQSVVRLSDDNFHLGISARHRDSLESWRTYRMSATSGQLEGYSWSTNTTSVVIDASVALPDGDVVSVGSIRQSGANTQAIIVREGAGGTPVFQRILNLPPDRQGGFHDIKLMEDGSLLVVGTVFRGGRGIIMANFQPDGVLNWSRKYVLSDGPGDATALLTLLPGNTFAFSIALSESSFANDGVRTLIVRCDAEGIVQYASSYGSTVTLQPFDLLLKPDGNLFFAGSIRLPDDFFLRGIVVELDQEGGIVDQRIWGGPGRRTFFRKMVPWHNGQGYYLVGGGTECPRDNPQMMIVSVDDDLNPSEGHCLERRDFDVIVKNIEVTMTDETFGMVPADFSAQSAPGFIETPAFSSELVCLNLTLDDNARIDTLCYRGEVALNRLISVADDRDIALDSVVISLTAPDPNDYLSLPASADYNLSGELSTRVTALPNTSLNSQELLEVIRGLRFGNSDTTPTTGLRTVIISVYYDCEKVETTSFSIFVYGLSATIQGFPVDTILCSGETLLLNAATRGATAYRWSTGSTDSVISVIETGTYAVEVRDYCQLDTFEISVTEALVPELADREEFLFSCLGDSVPFMPNVSPEIERAWEDGSPMMDRFFTESGTYQMIQSTECAEGIITVNVTVKSCCEVYLPNAFSPNGDGVNDRFLAFSGLNDCKLATNFRLQVFDRWGGLAFAGDGKEEGWDGTVAGQPARVGIYVFTLDYFNGETVISLAGSISLLR